MFTTGCLGVAEPEDGVVVGPSGLIEVTVGLVGVITPGLDEPDPEPDDGLLMPVPPGRTVLGFNEPMFDGLRPPPEIGAGAILPGLNDPVPEAPGLIDPEPEKSGLLPEMGGLMASGLRSSGILLPESGRWGFVMTGFLPLLSGFTMTGLRESVVGLGTPSGRRVDGASGFRPPRSGSTTVAGGRVTVGRDCGC